MERGSRVSTAIVAAAIGAAATVAAAVITAFWSSHDESASTGGAQPPQSNNPTTATAPPPVTTTTPTTNPETGYGDPITYQLKLSGGVFVDLDARTATFDGGRDFEFFYKGDINKSLFFGKDENIFGRSKVSLVPHDSARPETCEHSTRPQSRTVSGYFMEDDDVICISTSNGAWAVLDVLEWGGTGGKSAVMDVTLWPPKGAPATAAFGITQ